MMEFHPVAAIFPMMTTEEFDALKADIAKNGLREPIYTHEGKIIDGRNRYRACIEVGAPPRFKEWDGKGSLVEFVVSLNLHRRHLTQSQKAAASVASLPLFEAEARERQAHGLTAPGKTLEAILPEASAGTGRAREHAAKAFGVSPRYVSDAKSVAEDAPELFEQVRSGELTIPEAKREIRKAERETRKQSAVEQLRDTSAADGIFRTSITQWDAPECHLIFTDPPYHDVHVQSYADLGAFAMRRLLPGRFLCAYVGKLRLPDCINALSSAGLEWVWIFSVFHPFSTEKHLGAQYNIAENWRPVVVFRKPGALWKPKFQQDVIRGERNKEHHAWGQDEQTPEQLIDAYTEPGELVLDPFVGGGTTPFVARKLGRRCMGCDVDETAIALTTRRLRGDS